MSDYMDKTMLLVAKREDEDYPMVIGAMPRSTWEFFDVAEWDEWKRKTAQTFFDADWTAYDYIEVIVTIPNAQLSAMYDAREIVPVSVERDREADA